jgi:hypothetical protein
LAIDIKGYESITNINIARKISCWFLFLFGIFKTKKDNTINFIS